MSENIGPPWRARQYPVAEIAHPNGEACALDRSGNSFGQIDPHENRLRWIIRENIHLMDTLNGGTIDLPAVGFVELTLTHTSKNLSALRSIFGQKAFRKELDTQLREWVAVFGIGEMGGRAHVHLSGIARNADSKPNALARRIRDAGGFGRVFKGSRPRDVAALAFYLATNALHSRRKEGGTTFRISKSAHRVRSGFAWRQGEGSAFRNWLASLAKTLGGATEDNLRDILGNRWHGTLWRIWSESSSSDHALMEAGSLIQHFKDVRSGRPGLSDPEWMYTPEELASRAVSVESEPQECSDLARWAALIYEAKDEFLDAVGEASCPEPQRERNGGTPARPNTEGKSLPTPTPYPLLALNRQALAVDPANCSSPFKTFRLSPTHQQARAPPKQSGPRSPFRKTITKKGPQPRTRIERGTAEAWCDLFRVVGRFHHPPMSNV